jgi:hypothetical protein
VITTTDAAGMTHYIETYVVDFTNQRLYSYMRDAGEIINLKNVSFFPEMIDQNVESSGDGQSIAHVMRINLRTMEIVDRSDSVGTGYNSGISSHDVLAGTCKWISPLL